MSLRYDVHQAFDELAPTPQGLTERVVGASRAEAMQKPGRTIPLRLRVPLSLVAVLLLIAVVVAALMGSALVRDWARYSSPVPAHHLDLNRVHQLEARPQTQPLVLSNDECSAGPWDATSGWYGAGPVYLYDLISSGYVHPESGKWGIYVGYHAITPVAMTGPVLIRARNLVTGQPLVFVGRNAFGPVVGQDVMSGSPVQQQPEVVLDTDNPPPYGAAGHVDWGFTAAIHAPTVPAEFHKLQPFCVGWQVDGAGFSETFVVTI